MEDVIFESLSNRIDQSYSRALSFFSINYFLSFAISLAYEIIGSYEVLLQFVGGSFDSLIYRLYLHRFFSIPLKDIISACPREEELRILEFDQHYS